MDKKDFLKEAWNAVNDNNWTHGPATLEEKLRARAYMDDRPLANYSQAARSAYQNALTLQKWPESDYLAPVLAEYEAKAKAAESEFKAIIDGADKVPEIAIILAKIADIDARRAECLEAMDKGKPGYMMDALAVNWYTARAKTDLEKQLKQTAKEAALASKQACETYKAFLRAKGIVASLRQRQSFWR